MSIVKPVPKAPHNPKYPDIELKKGTKYRIVGKVVRKEKIY